MSLLKQVIQEMGGGGGGGAGGAAGGGAAGATGAGSIAGGMFAGGGGANTSKRGKKVTARNVVGEKPAKRVQMIRRPTAEGVVRGKSFLQRLTHDGDIYSGGLIRFERIQQQRFDALERAMSYIKEDITGSTDFDQADVISKLDSAEKKAKMDNDTQTFGLEDENGGLVRVYVRKDQADEFEEALSQMLANSDSNHDEENTTMEIAEVLFKLKDKFDIVDVDWGDIPQDEEQEQTVDAGGGAAGGAGGAAPPPGGEDGGGAGPGGGTTGDLDQAADELGGEEGGEGEGEEGEGGESEMEAGGDANSALKDVIDMMKADAKAKKAEADARAAEARAKEAEWTAKAAAAKVKQEEEVLDMETHEKEQKDMEKEAKRLAKLAKYRHDKASKYGSEMAGESEGSSEEEEQGGNRFPYDSNQYKGEPKTKVTLKQLRDMIYAHLRGDEH